MIISLLTIENEKNLIQFKEFIESDLKLIYSNLSRDRLQKELEKSNRVKNYFLTSLSKDLRKL